MLTRIFGDLKEYAPGIIKAALLLLLAWIIASIVRSIVNKVAGKARLDERAGSPVTASLASLVYWLTFLFFLPGILEALNLRQMLVPVQEMFNKIFAFIPNLLGAGIIFAVGYFIAKLVRQIITNVLSAAGLDEFSQKMGIASGLGKQTLSGLLGLISFVLIIVPVAQAALSKLQLDTVTRPVEAMITKLMGVVPGIIGAAAVLIISYYLGKIIGQFVANLLEGLGFNALLMRLGLPQSSDESGRTPAQLVGYLVTAAILVLAIMQAAEVMRVAGLSGLVSEFSVFAGHIISGVIVFGVGLYIANLVVMMIKEKYRIRQKPARSKGVYEENARPQYRCPAQLCPFIFLWGKVFRRLRCQPYSLPAGILLEHFLWYNVLTMCVVCVRWSPFQNETITSFLCRFFNQRHTRIIKLLAGLLFVLYSSCLDAPTC